MAYFINSAGERDGQTFILANTKEEAKEVYSRYYNVQDKFNVVLVFEH